MRFTIALVLSLAVSALQQYSESHGSNAGDIAAALLFFGYGVYCVQNFLRCHEMHCAITGPGFLIAGVLQLLRLFGVSISIGIPWLVFAGVYVLGMCVEMLYERTKVS